MGPEEFKNDFDRLKSASLSHFLLMDGVFLMAFLRILMRFYRVFRRLSDCTLNLLACVN